jgi:hypothetical protein
MADWYVAEPYCAFLEQLRDGNGGVTEHLNRFEQGGLYEPLLSNTDTSNGDYAVLDFRSPGAHQAKTHKKAHPNLYTIMLSDDYKTGEVMHMGAVIATVRVAGTAEAACIQLLNSWSCAL